MNHGLSGWYRDQAARYACDFSAEPVAPSGWDLLLRELGITDEEALGLIRHWPGPRDTKDADAARALKSYARTHRLGHYVPEDVLALLGLKAGVESYVGPLEMSVGR